MTYELERSADDWEAIHNNANLPGTFETNHSEQYMTGWEMLYESFRYYPRRPNSAIVCDFITYMDCNPILT